MYIAGLFAISNLLAWLLIIKSQDVELERSHIAPRRSWREKNSFPHFQDYYTGFWGDVLGVSLIDFAVGLTLSKGIFPSQYTVAIAALSIAIPFAFHKRFSSPRHRPDSQYPSIGVASLTGKIHFVYFSVQAFLITSFLVMATAMIIPPEALVVGWVGAAFYVVMLMLDIGRGHFDLVPNDAKDKRKI